MIESHRIPCELFTQSVTHLGHVLIIYSSLLCLEDWRDVVGFFCVWLCTFLCLRRRGDKTWASMSTSTSSAVALNSGFFWAMIWMTWLRLSGGRRPKLWPKCRFSSIDIARLLYKKHQSKTKPPDSWRNTQAEQKPKTTWKQQKTCWISDPRTCSLE